MATNEIVRVVNVFIVRMCKGVCVRTMLDLGDSAANKPHFMKLYKDRVGYSRKAHSGFTNGDALALRTNPIPSHPSALAFIPGPI